MADDQEQQLRDIFKAKSGRETSERAHELVETAFAGVSRTRARQRLARDFLRGRISANLPPAIRDAAVRHGGSLGSPNALEYHAPQIVTETLRQVAELGAKPPQPKRHPVARQRESGAVSYRIERVANAIGRTLYPYRRSCDPVMLDSEAASTVIPTTAHWQRPVDQYDYCPPEDWEKLPDDLKALWSYEEPRSTAGGGATEPGGSTNTSDRGRFRRYRRQYRRDEAGRPPWDDEYADEDGEKRFREDTKRSAEAVEEEIALRMRSKIPLEVDLLLPSEFAPVNPHWVGDELQVDGIATRRTYGGTDLYRSGYRWLPKGSDGGPTFIANPAWSSIAPVTLDTLLLRDGDGRPYLIYAVDGCKTWKQDGDRDFTDVIDLHDCYGYDFLPIVYQVALSTMTPEFDDMVIPHLEAMIVPSLMRDRLVAMNDFHTMQVSCGGWFVKIDPAIQAAMPELAQKPEFKVKQMTATPVPGDVVPAVHPGAGPGLLAQKEMLDQDLLLSQATGGRQGTSGIQTALLERDEARGSMAQPAVDALYESTISNGLRGLACMARHLNRPIELNILTDYPGDDSASSKRPTVVVDADMFGGDYRVVAWRPGAWGSDPTKQAMMQEAIKNKLETRVALLEEVGEADPWGKLADIFVEDLLLNTPEGKSIVLQEEAKINKDLQALERAKLRRDQLLNQEDVPTGFAGGVMDPNAALMSEQPGSAVPGVTMDVTTAAGANPATNQLNAAAGAPRAAVSQIAQAGGDVSGLDFGLGGG